MHEAWRLAIVDHLREIAVSLDLLGGWVGVNGLRAANNGRPATVDHGELVPDLFADCLVILLAHEAYLDLGQFVLLEEARAPVVLEEQLVLDGSGW